MNEAGYGINNDLVGGFNPSEHIRQIVSPIFGVNIQKIQVISHHLVISLSSNWPTASIQGSPGPVLAASQRLKDEIWRNPKRSQGIPLKR